MRLVEMVKIREKKVYIVEDHHHVLLAWADYRKCVAKAPVILSLDHHTDTHDAFLHHVYSLKGSYDLKTAKQLINLVDYNKSDSVFKAIANLRNDEHIYTGLGANLISKAFLITFQERSDNPPSFEEEEYRSNIMLRRILKYDETDKLKRPYTYPLSDIYIVENRCAIGCPRGPHNDDCIIPHFNQCIESVFLEHKLEIMSEMAPDLFLNSIFNTDYILDIDLDYFHTMDSARPNNPKEFYNLIKNASIITIAKESFWINQWKDEYDTNLNTDSLMEILLKHIELAMRA